MHRQLSSLYGGTADIMEQMPAIVIRLPVWRTGLNYNFETKDLIEFKNLLHLRQYARMYIENYSNEPVSDSRVRIKHAIEYKDCSGHQIAMLNVRHDIVDHGFGSIGAIIRVNCTTGDISKITHKDILEGPVFSGADDPRYFRRRGHWCIVFNARCHDRKRRIFIYLEESKRCVKLEVSEFELRDIEKIGHPLWWGM